MRKLALFMMVSIDGYFEGTHHELDWHNVDGEFNDFAARQLDDTSALIFGGRTYDMMATYWPAPMRQEDDPIIAEKMNKLPKVVFSRTLKEATWHKTMLLNDNLEAEITILKQEDGKDMLVLGSSNLCISLLKAGLLDEIRIMINPIAIGKGHSLFTGLDEKINLSLKDSRTFASGNVLLTYDVLR